MQTTNNRHDRFPVMPGRAARMGWAFLAALWLLGSAALTEAEAAKRPNILLLVADDMGSADIGPYGGEVSTPTLNSLAKNGLLFTNFHTSASCSPTRSMLLSGVDNHRNGMGTMAGNLLNPPAAPQVGKPGYEGYLNDRVVTVASLLRDSGYHTYMIGKWHLGDKDGFRPPQRGFEESYALMGGGYTHFQWDELAKAPKTEDTTFDFRENDIPVQWPADFYSSRNYTDKMIEYIDKHRDDRKPFFGYLAYTAPHSPLQAPEEYINKYIDKYKAGWDQLRAERFQHQKALGLLPPNLPEPPLRGRGFKPWTESTPAQQEIDARKMAVYAAMIDYLDMSMGRLIQHLKDTGLYEDTLIVFMSDNGPEANNLSAQFESAFKAAGIPVDNSAANIGNKDSYVSPAPGFALAANMPSYGAKATVAEGGIRNNFIVSYPRKIKGRHRTAAFASVLDVMPTLLSYARVSYPKTYGGKPVYPLNGLNMRALWEGRKNRVHVPGEPIGFELFGTVNKALFMGDWKILCLGNNPWGAGTQETWKLFNLKADEPEANDLSQSRPVRLRGMVQLYQRYQTRVGYVSATTGVDNCGFGTAAAAPMRSLEEGVESVTPTAAEEAGRPLTLRDLFSDDL